MGQVAVDGGSVAPPSGHALTETSGSYQTVKATEIEDNSEAIAKTMADAYDKAMATDAPSAPPQSADPASAPPRDAQGRFVAATTDPAKPADMSQADETTPPAAEIPAETPVAEVTAPIVEPPHAWPQTAKDAFAKLPADVQQTLAQHEAERDKGFNAKLQESHAARQVAEAFEATVRPYLPIIQSEGGTPIAAVQQLLATAVQIRQNPAATIAQLAHQFNVDLTALASGQYQPPQVDPVLADAQRRLNALESQRAMEKQQAEQQQISQAQTEVDAFKASGKAPHFESVREDMAVLIKEGRCATLQDAYDKAIRMNDGIWQKAQAEKVAAEAKRKADEAKRASIVNVRSAPAVTASAKPGSVAETMSATYDRLMGTG